MKYDASNRLTGSINRDHIQITGIECATIIGVYPEERKAARPLLIDIVLPCDCRRAAQHDQLEDAVDYAAVVAAVRDCVANQFPQLLETLLEVLAHHLLHHFSLAWVTLTVHKPGIIADVTDIAVSLTRHAGGIDG